jgi:hypothetical protein
MQIVAMPPNRERKRIQHSYARTKTGAQTNLR